MVKCKLEIEVRFLSKEKFKMILNIIVLYNFKKIKLQIVDLQLNLKCVKK